MNHDAFHNFCSGASALVIAGGVIVGGLWSRHVYRELRQKDNAAYQLFTNQAQLQNLRLQVEEAQEKSRRAFGLITLATTPLDAPSRSECFLQVNATVENAGTREIRLDFGGDSAMVDTAMPLHVARILTGRRQHYRFQPVAHVPVYSFTKQGDTVMALPESSLLPGESSTYPFLLRLPRSDMYLLQFRVPVDTAHSSERSDTTALGWFWTARSYVPGCTRTTSAAYPAASRGAAP